jgi:hypothetical protein
MAIGASEWIYEKLSSQGVEKGDAKYLGYEKSVRTLIRESIQNSMDARTESAKKNNEPAEIKIKMICLTGKEKEKLLKALNWDLVKQHVDEAAETEPKYNDIIRSIKVAKYFTVFVIEDYNCIGLRGGEFPKQEDRMKQYRGFVKSEHINVKEHSGEGAGSGGTYGVGKFIFWRYANTSLVFANSNVEDIDEDWNPSDDCKNPRLIGMSRLPSHSFKDYVVEGKGFFGKTNWAEDITEDTKKQAAENEQIMEKHVTTCSLWNSEADKISRSIGLYRDGKKTGTSIGVYGYTGDTIGLGEVTPRWLDEKEIPNLTNEIIYNWWKHIHDGTLKVEIELFTSLNENASPDSSNEIEVGRDHPMVGPLVKMYEKYNDGKYTVVEGEDKIPRDKLCVVKVGTKIRTDDNLKSKQAKRKGIKKHDWTRVDADLLIYVPTDIMADRTVLDEFYRYQTTIRGTGKSFATLNTVGLIRGGGPVIRYDDKRFGGKRVKDYFALLIAGQARGSTEDDRKLEFFLRSCEDEGHTDWWKKQHQLKNVYDSYPKSRTRLQSEITESLDKMLVISPEESNKLRKNLARFLKFGKKGKGAPKPKFSVSGSGTFEDNCWKVSGTVRTPPGYEGSWAVNLWPYYKSDKGSEFPVRVKEHSLEDGTGIVSEIDNKGKVVLDVDDGVNEIDFKLTTDKVTDFSGSLGRLGLALRRLKRE